MKKLILPLLSLFILLSNADGRFWTNKEGISFEGELVDVKDNAVTIRRTSDRRKFTLNVADLAPGDQEYLKELAEKEKSEEEMNGDKSKSSKDNLPKTKEELAKWLVGTEWSLEETNPNSGKKYSTIVRRFHADGVLLFQSSILKWDKRRPSGRLKYHILSEKSVAYGVKGWEIVFDKRFKAFKGKTVDGKKCTGEFVERFMEF